MKALRSKRYHSVTEAAKLLRVSRAAVYDAIKRRKLNATWGKFVRVQEGWRISSKDLHDYVRSLCRQRREKKLNTAVRAEYPNHRLGMLLVKKLAQLRLTQRELAFRCGLTPTYINQLIKGKRRRPSFEAARKLARGLGVSLKAIGQALQAF